MTGSVSDVFQQILAALDKLEIRYAVGGSVASSLRGNYRFTNDVDILVEMSPDQVQDFVHEIGPEFYADADSIRAAFRLSRPCNVIHKKTAFKFDFFPAAADGFAQSQLGRRTYEESEIFGRPIEFAVTTAEDILLAKLRWYRLGGDSSEQQWKDVSAIVAVQGNRLDRAYLDHWASEIGVMDLLELLLRD